MDQILAEIVLRMLQVSDAVIRRISMMNGMKAVIHRPIWLIGWITRELRPCLGLMNNCDWRLWSRLRNCMENCQRSRISTIRHAPIFCAANPIEARKFYLRSLPSKKSHWWKAPRGTNFEGLNLWHENMKLLWFRSVKIGNPVLACCAFFILSWASKNNEWLINWLIN